MPDFMFALFPDAPEWALWLAVVPLAILIVLVVSALFPAPLEKVLHGRDEHEGAELPRRRAARGRHHEGKTPALDADKEAAGDGDAASPAGLGSSVTV